jgi:muramoyltetrapeptide carboxypeptidase
MVIKPHKLNREDCIALVSTSSALSALFPRRLERAVSFLTNQGYEIKLGKTVYLNRNGKAGTIEERISDLQEQFLDDKVKAIITTAGGLCCNELLPGIDYGLIKEHPKIFCGYSDNTLLSAAFATQSNLVTFYGPCAVTEFGEYPKPLNYTWTNFRRAVEGQLKLVRPASYGTDEFIDWFSPQEKERKLTPSKGLEWLHHGIASGSLIGGCLPSLNQLKGTPYNYDYTNSILFLDIPEGETLGKGLSPERVSMMLSDLYLTEIPNQIKGLVVGRLFRQSEEDKRRIIDAVYKKTIHQNIPVLYGVDITHSDPQLTVPIGVNTTIDSYNDAFKINEQGVEDD